MPRVVVILPTTTYRASDFLDAASSLDIDLIVASEEPPPIEMGDRFLQVDISNPTSAAEAIVRYGDRYAIDGVVAADDLGVMIAAHANTLLGLAGNPPESASATRNKLMMRNRLASAEVDQPRFHALRPEDQPDDIGEEIGYPLVVKPIDRSASQGVIKVDRPEDIHATVDRVRRIVGEQATLLVEAYAPGVELAIEGLVEHGELVTLAVFDKPDTGNGPFFPETLFITPSRLEPESLANATQTASQAVRALGLSQGPVHIELRVDSNRARIIEVAARSIGGLCSRSLNFGLMGTTLESLILRNALDLARTQLKRERVASGVLMIPTPSSGRLLEVAGLDDARSIEGITGADLTIPPGGTITAPPEGDRYLGFVYGRAETPELVESALRKAQESIEVRLEA